MSRRKEIDMLNGPLGGRLILFALPIAASSMFQQLFNAADTAVVGKFADADALAAVGTNGEIVALMVSLSIGLAVGTNVLLARLIGSGKKDKVNEAVHTSLMLAIIIGVIGALAGHIAARPVLMLIDTPDSILELAVEYLKIYFVGYPALLVYDFGSAILRANGDSRRPFVILILSGAANLLLNLFFVIVCKMGVTGVAAATDIATLISAVMVAVLLMREKGEFRFDIRRMGLNGGYVAELLKIGIPAALQGAVFCFANIFVQAAVNSFGAAATAGSAIAMNFEYFGYYMITAFGQAATTFTSQNYAAGNNDRCRKVLVLCIIDSIIFSAIVIVPLVVFRSGACVLFSSDANVIEEACLRIMTILVLECVCGIYEVQAGYLRGMGYSSAPAVTTIIGTCLVRIGWIETVFRVHHVRRVLFAVFPLSWVITSVLMWGVMIFALVRKGNRHDIVR